LDAAVRVAKMLSCDCAQNPILVGTLAQNEILCLLIEFPDKKLNFFRTFIHQLGYRSGNVDKFENYFLELETAEHHFILSPCANQRVRTLGRLNNLSVVECVQLLGHF